ncbi:MAG: hypothetical protein AAGK01_03720 [Pseudomonadota bacterium]
MTNLHRLPVALAALTAASPALAHEADFLHNHGEGLLAVAAIGVVGALAYKFIRSIARK